MTAFTDLVGCELPIQLAGMGGGVSDVALATAVSEAGGLGMLGLTGYPPTLVTQFLDALPAGPPFGANFLVPFLDRDSVAVAGERLRVVDFFYDTPDADLVELVQRGGALAGWQVGSGAEARAAGDAGCDFVIAQGTEAGGHVRGDLPFAAAIEEVLGAVDVPVVAAGGIGTAEEVKRAFDAGASAVRVGTRFLAAAESSAHPEYIDALIRASADDTVLTEAFSDGWPDAPHRVLRSCVDAAERADDVVGTGSIAGMEFPINRWNTLPPNASATGNIAAMALYAGTSVGGVRERRPAAEIVAELLSLV
jgi:nitronate monooxygenase